VGELDCAGEGVKLVGLTPFPILPAHFGGAERCWNVLKRLGPIDIHGLDWEGRFDEQEIGDVWYTVRPPSPEAIARARVLVAQGFMTYDTMPHMARAFLDEYREVIEESNADMIILEHPFLVDFVGDRPFIYDSHNAETLSHGQRFGFDSPEFLHVKELERRAVQGAEAVTYCSEADAGTLREMFGDFHGVHVPNGVTLPELRDDVERDVLLFVGSVYKPNIEAAQRLVQLAPMLRDFEIVIAGPCGYYVQNLEPNVTIVGSISDRKLDGLFRRAVAFVNLVSHGSGTHLKVGRALAYGVPVITSQIGARGYSSPIVTDDVPGAVAEVVADAQRFRESARAEAETISWDKVVEPMRELVGR
jgi:glycosyltransferase involved in cell wall biosynthesis